MKIVIKISEAEDKENVIIENDSEPKIEVDDVYFAVCQLFMTLSTIVKLDMVEVAIQLQKEADENIASIAKEETKE